MGVEREEWGWSGENLAAKRDFNTVVRINIPTLYTLPWCTWCSDEIFIREIGSEYALYNICKCREFAELQHFMYSNFR